MDSAPNQPNIPEQPAQPTPPPVAVNGQPAPQPGTGGYPPAAPGKGLSIAGFVLAIIGLVTFGFTSLIGLILSIIGRVKSKKAGQPSGLALAGIIVSAVSLVVGLIVGILLFTFVFSVGMDSINKCKELGTGTHPGVTIGGVNGTLTCDADGSPSFRSSTSD